MKFNRFYISIFLFIVLLSSLGALGVYAFTHEHMLVSRYLVLLLFLATTAYMICVLRRFTGIIEAFVSNVKQNEFSAIPTSGHSMSREFNELMVALNDKIQKVRIEKEEQYHFFKTAINQAASGIIVYNKQGKVLLSNRALIRILNVKNVKSLNDLNQSELVEKLLRPEERSFLFRTRIQSELQKLVIQINDFRLYQDDLRVASLQNVSEEISKEELEAWKKLIHVITHEIMNSVTPVKTLLYSLEKMFSENNKALSVEKVDQDILDDTHKSLVAINNRMNGLMNYVGEYRRLYKLPVPHFENFNLKQCLDEILTVFGNDLVRRKIDLNLTVPDEFEIFGDREMISQVLINLIKNAIEASYHTSEPTIGIHAHQDIREQVISVKDNGTGIDKDIIDQIFVPFFTTKKQGTGVGLYYAKMIIFMHHGNLLVRSEEKEGTEFIIKL